MTQRWYYYVYDNNYLDAIQLFYVRNEQCNVAEDTNYKRIAYWLYVIIYYNIKKVYVYRSDDLMPTCSIYLTEPTRYNNNYQQLCRFFHSVS